MIRAANERKLIIPQIGNAEKNYKIITMTTKYAKNLSSNFSRRMRSTYNPLSSTSEINSSSFLGSFFRELDLLVKTFSNLSEHERKGQMNFMSKERIKLEGESLRDDHASDTLIVSCPWLNLKIHG